MSTDVILKNEVTVEKSNIEIGDLADISSPEIAGLVLDSAPDHGSTVTWNASEISKRLRPFQSALKDYHFKIPKFIRIVRGDSSFNEKLLKEKISSMLLGTLPGPGWEVNLKEIQKVQPPELSATSRWKVVPFTQRPRGPAQFEIVIEDQGKSLNHIWINGSVEYFAKVGVLQRSVPARYKINQTDVVWEKKNMTFISEIPVSEGDFASAVTKMSLISGTILTKNHFERELALKFGEEVEVKAGSDEFSVTTRAIAQQNGYIGDSVRVRSVSNQKTLTGILVAKGLVQVNY